MNLDIKTFKIETENLLLVPVSMDYVEEMFKEFTDDITKYMYPPTPKEIKETADFITFSINKFLKNEDVTVVILKKDTKEYLGNGGIHKINTKTPELGVWIKKGAHGHGYGKEAMIGLKKWADENLDYEYIKYPVAEENIASRKIPESLGGKETNKYSQVNGNGVALNIVEYYIFPTK